MTEEVIFTYYTVAHPKTMRIARDSHGKIREYKTPESARANWKSNGYGEPAVLKVTITRV